MKSLEEHRVERHEVILFNLLDSVFSEAALECSIDQAASATPFSDDAEATAELFEPAQYQK